MAETASERPSAARKNKSTVVKRGTSTRKRRRDEDEETVVLSGRLMTAALILAAMFAIPNLGVFGDLLSPDVPQPSGTWEVGQEATVHITVITADYNKLSCASKETFDGKRCEYETETERFPMKPGDALDDNKAHVIQPYRTPNDNQLIMVAGLWANPVIATRLHNEPPTGVPEKKLARFVTACKVKFIGNMSRPGLRWAPGGKWIYEGDAKVAVPIDCEILKPIDQ